jgi:Tol biopolymer transport system component/predicted Ser/Thr protein kinase
MPLQAGTRLGPYEILAQIGAGSMGEVYRARDPRLGREVAIKVLPPAFADDPPRLARFEQEARAAAALNHPNILAVYELGHDRGSEFIVSELLEGRSLREQLREGPLPVRRALDYAVQIAHGLAAAHEKGILHRDLKPENIFITSAGHVKILDFGLAKLTEQAPAGNVGSVVPTNPPGTEPGLVLGTVGYMAPEQVRGLPADSRSDIFAFGAILYEMLAGQPPFRRETVADTMSAILKEDPPEIAPERHVPPFLVRIAFRCLEKTPAMRFQSTEDLAFALVSSPSSDLETHPLVTEERPAAGRGLSRRRLPRWAAVVAAIAVLELVAAAILSRRQPATDGLAVRLSVPLPPTLVQIDQMIRVSPDGTRLAFAATAADGTRRLWIRSLDALEPYALMETEGASQPFWSPDGRSVGFFANGQLKRLDLAGASTTTLCGALQAAGATWNRSDVIVFSSGGGLQRIPAAGGEATSLPGTNGHRAGSTLAWPSFLPDGKHIIYLDTGSGGVGEAAIYAADIDSPERTLVLQAASSNAWYSNGYLFFLRDTTLVAQPFDTGKLALSGVPITIAEQVQRTAFGAPLGSFTVSDQVLAYRTGAGARGFPTELTWFDRSGKALGRVGQRADYGDVSISPDGMKAVVSMLDPGTGRDLWIFDLRRGVPTRFTTDPADEYFSVWSPDSTAMIFASRRRGHFDLYRKSTTGSAPAQQLLVDNRDKFPMSWSSDGRLLLYSTGTLSIVGNRGHLWALPLVGDAKPYPVLDDPNFSQYPGQLSPDGHWIAYASNESAAQSDIYVAAFPSLSSKVRVTTSGASWPRWRRDGRELFFLSPDNKLMAASVTTSGGQLTVGAVQTLFEAQWRRDARYPYDVAPNGNILGAVLVEPPTAAPITMLVNWVSGLKK